nr:hypothetical protein [Acidiferrobacter sp.]
MLERPTASTLALFDQRHVSFMLEDIELIAGLDMKPIAYVFRYRNLAFRTQKWHGVAPLLI